MLRSLVGSEMCIRDRIILMTLKTMLFPPKNNAESAEAVLAVQQKDKEENNKE